ncbi:MAG: hypothetical protein EXR66_06945 [Dehalococcoidia bacterium]|nr:hypothetical protein [Dehalococcoidia bacterium]
MLEVQLTQREARLVYLATLYHLGRPGTEIDPMTREPHDLGLRPVHDALLADLEGPSATATLGLSEYQLGRLGEALLGLVNELKQIELSGRSVVRGLFEALARTFPEEISADDPGGAIDLAGEATMLRRRLASAIRAAEATLEAARAAQQTAVADTRPWWKVWG